MKNYWLLAGAIAVAVSAWTDVEGAESGTAGDESRGYVCVPDASGDDWECSADTGQSSVLNWGTVAPDKPAVEPTAGVEPMVDADPVTGLSNDPEDWYRATEPRPTLAEYAPARDLAADLYEENPHSDGFCPGDYRVRSYPHPAQADDSQFPIFIEADQLHTELDVSADLQGNVLVEQGNRKIVAPRANLAYDTRIATFDEGVRLDQPGMVMQGEQASMHLNTKQATLDEVQFVLLDAQIRGRAAQIQQSPEGDLTLSANDFTRCEPDNNGWSLSTRELVIEKDAVFGTAKGAVLRVKSVPVFYSPWLEFPVSDERVSGFLFPNLGYSDEDGVDVSIPYYLNLAPNYDATIIPRYISDRGAGGELELRHMSSWQTTVLSGGMLPGDDLYNGFIDREDFDEAGGEALLGSFDPADRWLGAIDHIGQIGNFRTRIDFTSVSDRDYFRDLGSDLSVSSRRELQRRAELQYASGGLFMRLWAQRFQRLDEVQIDDYERLPELELVYNRGLVGPLEFSLGAKISEFDRDNEGLSGLASLTGSRTHIEPRLRVPLAWPFGFVTLSGGYRYTAYDLDQPADAGGLQIADTSPDRRIGLGSFDAGLFFERDLNWFGQSLIQTLEPRVYYLYQEYDDQDELPRFDASRLTFGYSQLFRDNRFSGLDRIGDADQASVGLTTRFLSSQTGREYFRFSLGEIFYFDDRRVTLSGNRAIDEMRDSSAIATEMSALLAGNWRLTGSMVWNPHDNAVEESGAGIQYRRDNRHIFNLGFRKRVEDDIEQSDVSIYWPITDRLAIMGRWNYDLVSNRTIEGFGGIEYSDCCLQVRLMARRFLDSPTARNFEFIEADDGIFLQIIFKGLAGFGTKVESVLERGVRGYRAPNAQDYFTN